MSAILLLIALLTVDRIGATETCTNKLDVTFVAESSSLCKGLKPCPWWDAIIQLFKDITDRLTIGLDESRVAFVTGSDELKLKWRLNGFVDKKSLLAAFDGVDFEEGELSNLLSTHIIPTSIFKEGLGDRLYVPDVILGITDGLPLIDSIEAFAAANALQKLGIKIYVVCIAPGCTESWAKGVASQPKQANETYFLVDSIVSLGDILIRDNLIKQICPI